MHSSSCTREAVHPRLRGELFLTELIKSFHHGSSPLTRGTQVSAELDLPRVRFIPAYAGNSPCHLLKRYRNSVHPRLRGELLSRRYFSVTGNGSSPLTRGTLDGRGADIALRRFIPAYAGNSTLKNLMLDAMTVHPRLRGELHISISWCGVLTGSSPLTRGTRGSENQENDKQTVHPRLRGELFRR